MLQLHLFCFKICPLFNEMGLIVPYRLKLLSASRRYSPGCALASSTTSLHLVLGF
jgi:hypothetical protein